MSAVEVQLLTLITQPAAGVQALTCHSVEYHLDLHFYTRHHRRAHTMVSSFLLNRKTKRVIPKEPSPNTTAHTAPSQPTTFQPILLTSSVLVLSFLRLRFRTRLKIQTRSPLSRVPTEVDPFPEFPRLDAEEEEQGCDDDRRPLPRDGGVLEDDVVDDGDIEGEEDGDEAEDDGPKQDFVAADVVDPRWAGGC
jgi:hypothetical protein